MSRINKDIKTLEKEAIKMVREIAKKSECEACMHQLIKALSLVRENHNVDSCMKYKQYRCYAFHNKKLESKIRKLL